MLNKKRRLLRKLFSKGKYCPGSITNIEKYGSHPSQIGKLTQEDVGRKESSQVAPSPPLSGLLAAKLMCDEWGLEERKNSVEASRTATKLLSVPQIPPPPPSEISTVLSSSRNNNNLTSTKTVEIRDSKVNHPSYKPPSQQRSHSMKERREAKEKTMMKYCGFFASLQSIKEEVEIEGIENVNLVVYESS